MLKHLKNLIKDPERKSLFTITLEFVRYSLAEKEITNFYFSNLLYKKDVKNYKDYIGKKNRLKVKNNLFDPYDVSGLSDKLKFSEIMENNSLPSPSTKRLSSNGLFFVDESLVELTEAEFMIFLNKIIEESSGNSIFIKPVNLNGGRNCFELNNISNKVKINKIYNLLKKEDFIYQDTLKQHPSISTIYPHSINTIRIHSYFDKEREEVEILSALMRFGRNGIKVDNGSSGGLFVGVDLEEWCLRGIGKTYFKKGGRYFDKHPDSGVCFDDYKLPFKNDLYKIIDKGARLFENEVIGWDVAITQDGLSIIEGNYSPHLVMAQVANCGFRNDDNFMKVIGKYIN